MIQLRRILVPTDLSKFSFTALEYARSLAVMYDARVYMLYVSDTGRSGGATQEETATQALRHLEDVIHAEIENGHEVIPMARRGVPAREIARFAREEGIDLIVMATHGRTGVPHILLGSVAERVVREAPVPVMTVKPQPIREAYIREEDIEQDLHLL